MDDVLAAIGECMPGRRVDKPGSPPGTSTEKKQEASEYKKQATASGEQRYRTRVVETRSAVQRTQEEQNSWPRGEDVHRECVAR